MNTLEGKSILIVEDEALLAFDLSLSVEDAGGLVTGPCHSLTEALQTAELATITAAILDVDLAGEPVFPLADTLKKRGIPFVFHTGRSDMVELAERYTKTPICQKPTPNEQILAALQAMLDGVITPEPDHA